MRKTKVIAIGSGAQNIFNSAPKHYEILSIDNPEGGNNLAAGQLLAENSFEAIDRFIGNTTDRLFLVSTLGGGTGTGAIPTIISHLASKGNKTVSIVTLPLKFEGRRKMDKSLDALWQIEADSTLTIVINQEHLMAEMGNVKISDFFTRVDREVLQIIDHYTNKNRTLWNRLFGK